MPDMLRIQEEAKDRGYDSAEFFISAPKGVFDAKWMDAYFGFFTMPALGDGFVTERQLPRGCEGFWERADAVAHFEENFAPLADLMAALEQGSNLAHGE